MPQDLNNQIITEVKKVSDKFVKSSEIADLESLLSCYEDSAIFLHISSDGMRRKYDEFRSICAEYYHNLETQKVMTTEEEFLVIEPNLVILSWTGNIIARFKNGTTMTMNNYSVTDVFKKKEGKWRIIYAHESALPPEIS
jgi:uncharacterized protein (TIGR02246 family)